MKYLKKNLVGTHFNDATTLLKENYETTLFGGIVATCVNLAGNL